MIWLLLGTLVPGFLVAWSASHFVRAMAARWGWVDRPGPRKLHAAPMPTSGGTAIWLAVVAPFALGYAMVGLVAVGAVPVHMLPNIVQTHWHGLLGQAGKLWALLALGTLLMGLGFLDDRRGLDWRLRLGVQVAVAILLVGNGLRLTFFLDVPLFTAVLSVVWIVAVINAFNLLDNMNGLSAGVAAIASSFLAAVMLLAPEPDTHTPQLFVAGFLLLLVGALLGFLWHNYPPAKLFMGNAGSYFVGFHVATATVMATFAGGDMPRHAVLAPICVLAIPLYDMVSVVLIRIRQGRSPFVGDTSHFSHRLVELGLSQKHAVWTIYLATATCSLGALLLYQVDSAGAAIVLLMVASVLTIIAILESTGRKNDE